MFLVGTAAIELKYVGYPWHFRVCGFRVLIWQHYSNNTLQFSLAWQILCNKPCVWTPANQHLKSCQMCEVYEPFYFWLATKCGGGEENIIHFSLMEEAHTARIFTQAKQKQLHGRVKANLIGFNSEREVARGGRRGAIEACTFSVCGRKTLQLQKEGHNDAGDYLWEPQNKSAFSQSRPWVV